MVEPKLLRGRQKNKQTNKKTSVKLKKEEKMFSIVLFLVWLSMEASNFRKRQDKYMLVQDNYILV